MGLFGIDLKKGRDINEYNVFCMCMKIAAKIREKECDYSDAKKDAEIGAKLQAGKKVTKDDVRVIVEELEMISENLYSLVREKKVLVVESDSVMSEERVVALTRVALLLAGELEDKYL